MARKPIEQEKGKKGSPRERLWAAARTLRSFTLGDLQHATRRPAVPFTTCETYLQLLVAGGFVHISEPSGRGPDGRVTAARYRLVKDSLTAPRLDRQAKPVTQGHGTLAMWRTMQILKVFDWHDILRAASHPDMPISPASAKKYVAELALAGYFQLVSASKPGTAARYRLARNTGPQPPAVTREKRVFDRNLGTFLKRPGISNSTEPGGECRS